MCRYCRIFFQTNLTWPNNKDIICYAHPSSLKPITIKFCQKFSMLSLLYNSFLFNNYSSFHTCISFIHGHKSYSHNCKNEMQFTEFCRGQTGYNDSECKEQHWIRMCNTCKINVAWTIRWMLVFANFLFARHKNKKKPIYSNKLPKNKV